MAQNFILGCPCGMHLPIDTQESRKEIRCQKCGRYIKIPPLLKKIDMRTQTLASQSKDDIIGKVLAKRYKISSYLADGAMGRVYRGTDLLLNLPVAIKILKHVSSISDLQEKRFIHEAHIASELVHPGIVMVRNLHRSRKGGYFMVMDLCPGKSLKTILETRHHLSIEESLEITKQILSALKVAHEKGIVHRDIKPGNIMVEETENSFKVRILDFGIAKIFSKQGGLDLPSLTRTGYVVGTTYYMAPEQIMKLPLSPATDIYGVGALLYHLLTGLPPFLGTREKVLSSIIKKNPEPVRTIYRKKNYNQNIPLLLDAIILKALSKDSKHRFSHVQEFIDAIELYQKSDKRAIRKAWLWIAQGYWGSLGKDVRKMMLGILVFLILFPLPFYIQKIAKKDMVNPRQVQEAIEKQEYEKAYLLICKDQNQTKAIKIELLRKAFYSALSKGNRAKAKDILQLFFQEINNPFLQKKFEALFQEDTHLNKIEELLEKKEYPKAWKACQENQSEENIFFFTREERKEWLKRIEN